MKRWGLDQGDYKMFDDRIVTDLKDKYADTKNNFDEVLLQLRSKTVKS